MTTSATDSGAPAPANGNQGDHLDIHSVATAETRVTDALRNCGAKMVKTPGGLMAQCPAHNDRTPSLSVTRSAEGVLLYCHAGCTIDAVLASLGLNRRDLFDRPERTYLYTDVQGKFLREVRRLDTATGKRITSPGSREGVALYRAPDIVAAVAKGEPVILVEGEKDATNVAAAWHFVATTALGGADAFNRADVSALKGATVIAIVDRDEPGDKWAAQVQASVGPIAEKLTFALAHYGHDASDHLAGGGTLADLEPYAPPPIVKASTEPVAPAPPKSRLRTKRASEIPMRATRWLWDLNVPLGEIVLLAGREGIGKSTFLYWLVALITRGEVPGEFYGTPRAVIIVATEDSWEATIVPRLTAENANLELVIQVDAVQLLNEDGEPSADVPVLLPRDLDELRDLITETHAVAVLLDPLMSRMDGRLDTHKDHDVRVALEPLARMAHDHAVTVLGIIHMNKTISTDVLTTVMGSRAFAAVARAVLVAMRDPESEAQRLVGVAKSNLGPDDRPAMRYTVEQVTVGAEEDGRPITATRFVDRGPHHSTIRDAGRKSAEIASQVKREKTTVTGRCEAWLRAELEAAGTEGLLRSDVINAGLIAGFSENIVKRASQNIGVEHRKFSVGGPGFWRKPEFGWTGVHALRARGYTQDALIGLIGKTGPTGENSKPLVSPNALNESVSSNTPRAREGK